MKLLIPFTLLLAVLPGAAQRGPLPGISTATPYLIYYGDWTNTQAEFARDNYKLVILHPSVTNVTPAQIATIQAGPDTIPGNSDDVPVLAYISVGEDDRPGAPFAGDGSGPRIDPRAADSDPLAGVDPLGDPSTGGTGFASYYLDDNDLDGQPDQNATFGGYYVNPGDPAWFNIIKTKTKVATNRAGMDELLTTTTGAGYNCDGLFLDTLDTPAPNSFGATQFEWTAPAYQSLVAQISAEYPSKLLLGNRGLFFYNPNLKTYAYTLRPHLDLILFESYYTDSSGSGVPSAFFDDNKFNYAPKINAEAVRSDGFTVLCLGYTTAGEPASLGENDFLESQGVQGWPLYRTNPALDSTPFNTDAATWNAANPDVSPPVWDSTAASGATPPTPRVGIQEAVAGEGEVTVRWDVARDQTGPVTYNLYYTDQPTLDFNTATKLAAIEPVAPDSYVAGNITPTIYASEHTVTGLTNGTPYLFAVRAEDALAQEETNTVTISATPEAIPSDYRQIAIDGSFADWSGAPVLDSDPAESIDPDFAEVSAANDEDFLYIRFTLHNPAAAFTTFNTHLFIDTDNNPATGFVPGGSTVGSDFMIETGTGYDQRLGGFNDGATSGVQWSIADDGGPGEYELRIARSAIYSGDSSPVFSADVIRILLQDNAGDISAPAGILYKFAPPPPPPSHFANIAVDGNFSDWDSIPEILADPSADGVPDIVSVKVANDVNYLYVLVEYAAATDTNGFNGSPSTFLSLDNDNDTATGFDIFSLGSIGAEVSWQNDFAFSQSAGNYNSGATFTNAVPGIAPYAANTTAQEYRIARDASYDPGGGDQPVFPQDIIRLALWSNDASTAEFAGSFSYQFAEPPAYYATISIDGATTDWDSIPEIFSDPAADGTPDMVSVKVANDDNYLYLLVEYGGPVDTNNFNGSPSTFLSLDSDNDTTTGFNVYSLGEIGAEVSWQNNFPFAQDNVTYNLGATFDPAAVPAISPYFSNTTVQEYCIDRNATYDLGGGSQPVFPNDIIRLAFWTDGAPTEFAGGFTYQFAVNPGGDPYADWKLDNFDHLELADPLVGGDDADPDRDGLTNLAEFALGGDPFTFDAGPAVGTTTIGPDRYLTLTYTRRTDGSVSVTPESSSTLSGWDDTPAQFVTSPPTPAGPGYEEVVIRFTDPIPASPNFLRLSIELN